MKQRAFNEGVWYAIQFLVLSEDEPSLARDIIREMNVSKDVWEDIQYGTGHGNEKMLKFLRNALTDATHASEKLTDFSAFWDAYDKKVERRKAETLWARLSKRDRESAMAYLPAYKAAQPDKRFRKNPTTFLRNRTWEDEIIDQTPQTHAPLPHPTAQLADARRREVQELSRLATAGAAALAGLVGGGEDE